MKAKTPKITLYTAKAKSYLMENEPADFETYFYCGAKISCSGAAEPPAAAGSAGSVVKFIDIGGRLQTFDYPVDVSSVPSQCQLYLEHFTACLRHCRLIEASLAGVAGSASSEPPLFPLIVGRKPAQGGGGEKGGGVLTDSSVGDNSLEKENRAPGVVPHLASFKGTLLSTATTTHHNNIINHHQTSDYPTTTGQNRAPSSSARDRYANNGNAALPKLAASSVRSDVSRTIRIKGVGVARLLEDGSVQIDFEDSSGIVHVRRS